MEHSWGYGTEQRLREENQDCHGVFEFPEFTLSVVCDGMGGHVGGAQASTLAVRTIHDTMRELADLPVAEALVEAIQRTNLVIYEAARKNHRLMGMGTTVVASVVQGERCWLAHVGDSRAYLIRQGQVHQLTRDHTMVNLFVDAELLSPEDAATHPEAHVLSRSLGVERQVDVELSEELELVAGDVVFLCSDGIHGIVTDWELANVDWRAPHQAIQQVLDIVTNREGDDNATAVSVMLGTTFEDIPPTAPPEPKRFEDPNQFGALSGMTAVPIEDDLVDPDYGGGAPAGGPGYIVYEDHPQGGGRDEMVVAPPAASTRPEPPAPPPPAPLARSPEPVAAASVAPAKPAALAPPKAAKRRSSNLLPLLLASGALVMAGGVVVLLLLPSGGEGDGVDGEDEVVQLTPDRPTKAPTPPPPRPTAQAADPAPVEPATPDASDCPADGAVFAPKLPPPPRRLPYRATECTQPPPGGPEQFRAVETARRHDCRGSLQAVQAGMKKSVDHCRLYHQAWLCFDESHQRPLETAKSQTYDDIRFELYHFEGTPETQQSTWTEEQDRLPYWYRPAVDGLEYRLDLWNEDPQMAHYVNDLFGEPKVADDFAKDLHLEATLAAGLACVPEAERTPQLVDSWARRVYVVAHALNQDRTGRLLNQHRSDLLPVLRDLLVEATKEHHHADGTVIPVPAEVLEAYAVATGAKPPPTGKKVVVPRPFDPSKLEPDLGETEEGVQINQR